MRRIITIPFLVLASTRPSLGHGVLIGNSEQLWSAWTFDPGVVFSLAALAAFYWLGVAELKEAGVYGRAFKRWEFWSFVGGWSALVVALISPLHAWGGALFSAHMTQHEILMLAAAPLIVLGRPVVVLLKALPRRTRSGILRVARAPGISCFGGVLSNAFVAWLIHGVVLWVWHIPALFSATLRSDLVHALQHLSFFGSALLFWWAVLDGHQKRLGYGVGILYLFTTALHSGVLGALLTFSKDVWYSFYFGTTQSWGLSPLEDQQLGGLIMWIPASLAYIVAALALFVGWMREADLRSSATFVVEEGVAQ